MTWSHVDVFGLSSPRCVLCKGSGLRLRLQRSGAIPPGPDACDCVLRKIFRICLRQFRQYSSYDNPGQVVLTYVEGGKQTKAVGRPRQEFSADFVLLCKRNLDPQRYRIFRLYHLLGASHKVCSRKLNLDSGTLFHRIYRLEADLGRALAELQPYPLYPIDQYLAA